MYSLRNEPLLPVQGQGVGRFSGAFQKGLVAKPGPKAPGTQGPRGSGTADVWPAMAFFPCERLGCTRPGLIPLRLPTVATTPGVDLTQHGFRFGWLVLNAFAIPCGGRDKRIVF